MTSFDYLEVLIRSIALAALVTRDVYWRVTERASNRSKPLAKPRTPMASLKRLVLTGLVAIMYLQIIGLPIVPWPAGNWSVFAQSAGLIVLLIGLVICLAARRTLGDNWAHGAEYQIKAGHQLVTSGIYRLVRHPIYGGLMLMAIGT